MLSAFQVTRLTVTNIVSTMAVSGPGLIAYLIWLSIKSKTVRLLSCFQQYLDKLKLGPKNLRELNIRFRAYQCYLSGSASGKNNARKTVIGIFLNKAAKVAIKNHVKRTFTSFERRILFGAKHEISALHREGAIFGTDAELSAMVDNIRF